MIKELSVTAGWEITNSELNEGIYLITVQTTSCEPDFEEALHTQMHNDKVNHTHRVEQGLELLEFDHNPTKEIQAALDERGFNPVIPR
mgnify:CR=1 FL=1